MCIYLSPIILYLYLFIIFPYMLLITLYLFIICVYPFIICLHLFIINFYLFLKCLSRFMIIYLSTCLHLSRSFWSLWRRLALCLRTFILFPPVDVFRYLTSSNPEDNFRSRSSTVFTDIRRIRSSI